MLQILKTDFLPKLRADEETADAISYLSSLEKILSESGVMIESESLTKQFTGLVADTVDDKAYELFLNEDDKLRWRAYEDGQEKIYVKEPESTWTQRFIATIIRLLPVKSQL